MERWDQGGYDPSFMAKTIAFNRVRNAVDNHIRDTQIERQKTADRKARATRKKK